MKKIYLFNIFLLLLPTYSIAVEFNVAYGPDEIVPYIMGNSTQIPQEKPGIAVDVVLMLEKNVDNLKIKLKRYPWKRSQAELKHNKIDGIFAASYKKERLKLGWYPTTDGTHEGQIDTSRRIDTFSYSLYKLKGSKISWDGAKFINVDPNKKLGASLGQSIVEDLKSRGIKMVSCTSLICGFQMLNLKRVQGVVSWDVVGDKFLKYPEFQGIEKVTPPIVTKHYYLMISNQFVKQHPMLAQKIWDNIKIIRDTKMEMLVQKYAE